MDVSPTGGGDVEVDESVPPDYPYSFIYTVATNVHVEAVPAPGCVFANWSGDLTGTENPTDVMVDCRKTIVASFSCPTAAIGDHVWEDWDGDGIQDVAEPGIDGVEVNLYGSGDRPVGSTTTSGGGRYSFTGLEPGDYYVEFVAPEDHAFSPKDSGVHDTIDSDADPTGRTDVTTLGPGEVDLTWDCGLYRTEIASVPLLPGWNLVSFPVIADSASIEDILAGIMQYVDSVWAYNSGTGRDAGGSWSFYAPGEPSDLTEMTHSKGYWVKANDQCTLTVEGRVPHLPHEIALITGWNLIGLPLMEGPQAIGDILADIMQDVDSVWAYNRGTGRDTTGSWSFHAPGEPSDLTEMTHSKGYWVKVNDLCTLTIDLPQIIEDVTPSGAHALIQDNQGNPDFVTIDIRTPEEYEGGHIESAVNFDYYSQSFTEDLDSLDKNRTYLIYCRTGRRTGLALDTMRQLGFGEVYNMLGGITQWEAEGFPIVEPRLAKLSEVWPEEAWRLVYAYS